MRRFIVSPMALLLFVTLCLAGCSKESNDSISLQVSSDNIVDNPKVYKTSGKTIQPLDVSWYGPCTGEYIHVTGQIVATYNVIQKENSTNYAVQFHYQNTKGIGETTGRRYNIVGHNSSHLYQNFSFDDFNKVYTVSGRVMYVTQGESTRLVAISSFKFIQNGKGELIIDQDSYSFTCE